METLNIIIFVALIANVVLSVFLWTLILRSKDKVEELSYLINKSIMSNEESKKSLVDSVSAQNREILRAMLASTEESKIQFEYQRSFVEKNTNKTNIVLNDVKERLEYLATEVNID